MQLRTATALIALAGLAACGQPSGEQAAGANTATMNEEQLAQHQHRAPDPQKVMTERWDAMFASPDKVVAAINEMGYQLGAYARNGGGYATTSPLLVLPKDETPPATVKTTARVAGDHADRIDTITFTFDTHVSRDADKAKVSDILGFPRQIVNGVLQRFRVGPGDAVVYALTQFDSTATNHYGTTITVNATPGKGAGRTADQHVVVTISHHAAAAAKN